ncbi:MAG: hypothetical protein U5R48_06750 [Gammaproteobacteria bacterium]|nr:hypothetical protein [Gammaproteobacteria bacterium]
MSESTADNGATDQTEQATGGSKWWPDETVDAICGLVVISAATLGVLWYVVNG